MVLLFFFSGGRDVFALCQESFPSSMPFISACRKWFSLSGGSRLRDWIISNDAILTFCYCPKMKPFTEEPNLSQGPGWVWGADCFLQAVPGDSGSHAEPYLSVSALLCLAFRSQPHWPPLLPGSFPGALLIIQYNTVDICTNISWYYIQMEWAKHYTFSIHRIPGF